MLSLWQNKTRVRSWNPWILKDEVRQQHLHSQPSAVFVVRSQFTACERGALRFHKSSSPTGSRLLVQKTVRIIMETCKENMKRNHLGVYSALLEGGNDSGCLLESNKKLLTGTAPFTTVWCYFLIYIFKQTWYYFVFVFCFFSGHDVKFDTVAVNAGLLGFCIFDTVIKKEKRKVRRGTITTSKWASLH